MVPNDLDDGRYLREMVRVTVISDRDRACIIKPSFFRRFHLTDHRLVPADDDPLLPAAGNLLDIVTSLDCNADRTVVQN